VNRYNPNPPMKLGDWLVDFVDRVFYTLHPRRNAFWDGVPEPVPAELPEIEAWDTDPHGLTGLLAVRCRNCGMPPGAGCRTQSGRACGAHKERHEDANASGPVG
jgi:hypothetical protein